MLKNHFIKMNNSVFKLIQRKPLNSENVLLLVPHCLQNSDCEKNVIQNVDNCLRCGKCKVGGLLDLRDEFQVSFFLAAGGRQAVAKTREPWVKAIVAVACEKELYEGILATAPKPVLGIYNSRPFGFCKNTDVDLGEVRKILNQYTKSSRTFRSPEISL